MPSESYAPISDTEIAVDKPLTASLVARMRDNPLAMLKGSPSARAAGLGVFVQKDIGAGNQCGIQTDNLDTTAVLRPDGAGGVVWSSDTELKFLGRIAAGGFSDVVEKNITREARIGGPGYPYNCNEVLNIGVRCSSIQLLIDNYSGPVFTPNLNIKRGANFSTAINTTPGNNLINFADFLIGGISIGTTEPGDLLYIGSHDPFKAYPISFCFSSFP
jgi:hypothetical protein